MTAAREVLIASARKWATHADDDLRVAQHTLELKDQCPFRLVAYHAQQCAEKYLKSVLVLHGVDFPYTHNIAHLLELCAEHGTPAEDYGDAEELTPFAITARYPGDDEPVSEPEARRALDIARTVREKARAHLAAEGVNL